MTLWVRKLEKLTLDSSNSKDQKSRNNIPASYTQSKHQSPAQTPSKLPKLRRFSNLVIESVDRNASLGKITKQTNLTTKMKEYDSQLKAKLHRNLRRKFGKFSAYPQNLRNTKPQSASKNSTSKRKFPKKA